MAGAEELEQFPDEGRRVLLDLEGPVIVRIPDEVTVAIKATEGDVNGEWVEGEVGQALVRHDRPEIAIRWQSGATTVAQWPVSAPFQQYAEARTRNPYRSCSDGRGTAAPARVVTAIFQMGGKGCEKGGRKESILSQMKKGKV